MILYTKQRAQVPKFQNNGKFEFDEDEAKKNNPFYQNIKPATETFSPRDTGGVDSMSPSERRKGMARQQGEYNALQNPETARYKQTLDNREIDKRVEKHRAENLGLQMADASEYATEHLPPGLNALYGTLTAPWRFGANMAASMNSDYYENPNNTYLRSGKAAEDFAGMAAGAAMPVAGSWGSLADAAFDEATFGLKNIPGIYKNGVKPLVTSLFKGRKPSQLIAEVAEEVPNTARGFKEGLHELLNSKKLEKGMEAAYDASSIKGDVEEGWSPYFAENLHEGSERERSLSGEHKKNWWEM